MYKTNYLLVLLIFSVSSVFAQVEQSLRKEIEQEDSYNYEVIPFESKGALIKLTNVNKKEDLYEITLEMVDAGFKTLKTNKISYDREFDTYYYSTTKDAMYFMAVHPKNETFICYSIKIPNLEISKTTGQLEKKARIYDHAFLGNKLFFPSKYKDSHFLQIVDVISGKVEKTAMMEGFEEPEYYDMEVFDKENDNELLVKYEVCAKKRLCELHAIRFDNNGKLSGKTVSLPALEDKRFVGSRFTKSGANSYLVAGTYAQNKKGVNGFFATTLKDGVMGEVNYYNFLDMPRYLEYLPERTQKKIESKKDKKEVKGDEYTIDFNVALHDIYRQGENSVVIGEFYYPTYRTETYTQWIDGRAVTRTRTVFDGYQYSHAIISCFDKEGRMIWNNIFTMYLAYKPYTIRKFIRANVTDKNIDLVYVNSQTIKTISYVRGKVENEREINFVDTRDEDDKVKATSMGNMTHWFANNYIVYGSQKIKNKEREDKKRRVFYLNKVSYN